MSDSPFIRLGTRGSRLARWQAQWVADQLSRLGIVIQLVVIQTTGDVRSGPVDRMPIQGVFTKEIQRALLDQRIDLAVHSLKDLPTDPVEGLALAAVPPRAAVEDVLLTEVSESLEQLSHGAQVGTGSLRRRAQLLYVRPDLNVIPLRGNVESRLARLQSGEFDAMVLAQAGVDRLEISSRYVERLPTEIMLPAVGQGALGLETRVDDHATQRIAGALNDRSSFQAVAAERSALSRLQGGCSAPIGAWGRIIDGHLQLDAVVLDPNGTQRLYASLRGEVDRPVELGWCVADQLLSQGAAHLIAQCRHPEHRNGL